MRGTERIVGVVAVAIPVLITIVGWSMFGHWVAGPVQPPATPRVAGAAETSPAAAGAARTPVAAPSTDRQTPEATRPTPTAGAPTLTQVAAATPDLEPAVGTLASDPGAAVSTFYSLVSSHQFDSAAQLWSPRMRAAFPPDANLTERFRQTQIVRLQRAEVISQDQSQATVAVDLIEQDGQAGQRHFVGNWYLVRAEDGWMLDRPQLNPAP